MNADVTAPSSVPAPAPQPYPPSWIDRLLRWIERLSVPFPVVLVGLWAASVMLVHAVCWHEGIVPRWQLDTRILLINTWAPYCLGFIYYLENTAVEALAAFRPALDQDDSSFARLRYEFTVMPMRGALISNVAGALLAYGSLRFYPETAKPFMDTPFAAFVNMSLSMLGIAISFTAIYLAFRQLRLIRRTYAQATQLNLFHANQLYAFSSLTLRMGIGWLIVIYSGIILYPALVQNVPWIAGAGLILTGIAGAFLMTLFDIHTRIHSVKTQHLEEIDRRLQAAFAALHRRIDIAAAENTADAPSLASLRETMDALLVERGVIAKIPTWPWQPGTLAGFLTAILLPLVVWIIQSILKRLMGL